MVKGKTIDGYKYEIDDIKEIVDDRNFRLNLTKLISDQTTELEKENALDGLVKSIFNDPEKENEFYEFIKSKSNGRLSTEKIARNINSILEKLGENKEVKK